MKEKKVYVLSIAWSYDGENEREILGVYDTKDSFLLEHFAKLVAWERENTWVEQYVAEDFTLFPDMAEDVITYINESEYFSLVTQDGDFTELCITEKDVK